MYRTCITKEKENSFIVMLRWRYEETGLKLIQMKKKIKSIKEKMKKEEIKVTETKAAYEAMLNCKSEPKPFL